MKRNLFWQCFKLKAYQKWKQIFLNTDWQNVEGTATGSKLCLHCCTNGMPAALCMIEKDRGDSAVHHCHPVCLGFIRSYWVHQGWTHSRLCPHSDAQCDSRQQIPLSAVCLTAIWHDSSHQRVCFAQWFPFKLASPSSPNTIHLLGGVQWCLGCVWVVIDCWPPLQFLSLCL